MAYRDNGIAGNQEWVRISGMASDSSQSQIHSSQRWFLIPNPPIPIPNHLFHACQEPLELLHLCLRSAAGGICLLRVLLAPQQCPLQWQIQEFREFRLSRDPRTHSRTFLGRRIFLEIPQKTPRGIVPQKAQHLL